tara:strand:+ start:944 stop:1399 length:456 start_codon:yes stop_codon:yes gene_type:complete
VTPLVKKNTSKTLDEPLDEITEKLSESTERVAEIAKTSNQFIDRFKNSQNSIQEAFERSKFMGFYITQKIQNFFYKMISTIIVFYYMIITMINSTFIIVAALVKIGSFLIKKGMILIASQTTAALGVAAIGIGGVVKLSNETAKSQSKSQS